MRTDEFGHGDINVERPYQSPMSRSLADLSAAQLKRAVEIRSRIDDLNAELEPLLSTGSVVGRGRPPGRRGKISAAGSARIATAQRERWAKHRASLARHKTRR